MRASEERQFCTFQKLVAIPITRIANPMQAMNFSTIMYNMVPGTDFSTAASPTLLPPSTLTLTPPPSTGRGKKGRARSKRTVPKPTVATVENPATYSFHTPPESPEDCLDIMNCHHGDDLETPRSDLDDDDEEEMQDYRY